MWPVILKLHFALLSMEKFSNFFRFAAGGGGYQLILIYVRQMIPTPPSTIYGRNINKTNKLLFDVIYFVSLADITSYSKKGFYMLNILIVFVLMHYPLWQFLVRGTFTEQRCLIDKCFLRTQYCGNKWIKIVFYWIAAGVYWSAVSFTNPLVIITGPQCRLLICDVVYKSAV